MPSGRTGWRSISCANRSKTEIYDTQEAVRDLTPRLQWRQEYLAEGQLHADREAAYRKLLAWAGRPVRRTTLPLRILFNALTISTIFTVLALIIMPGAELWKAFKILTAVNLAIVAAHVKKIKTELEQINAMHRIVGQYGYLLQCMEKEPLPV